MYKEVNDREFVKTLDKAVKGDINAVYEIIDIYDGLIFRHSIINGVYNQECRDYLEDKIIEKIKNFKKI